MLRRLDSLKTRQKDMDTRQTEMKTKQNEMDTREIKIKATVDLLATQLQKEKKI